MSRSLLLIVPVFLSYLLVGGTKSLGQTGSTGFLYLSDQRIVTLEVVDSRSVILNYINLGDAYEVIEAPMLVLVDDSGDHYNGHLIALEDSGDPNHRFEVNDLVSPGEFSGYLIMGNFEHTSPLARAFLQVSGRIIEMESLSADEFELLAARIGELDLAAKDRKGAIERAGFVRGFGELIFAGSQEAIGLESYFPSAEVLPPVPIANPPPQLPTSEANRSDPVVVRVKATISRQGGLRDIQLAEGISPRLDEIALETVRNSWIFLPAISNSEVGESEVILNVVFKR